MRRHRGKTHSFVEIGHLPASAGNRLHVHQAGPFIRVVRSHPIGEICPWLSANGVWSNGEDFRTRQAQGDPELAEGRSPDSGSTIGRENV